MMWKSVVLDLNDFTWKGKRNRKQNPRSEENAKAGKYCYKQIIRCCNMADCFDEQLLRCI